MRRLSSSLVFTKAYSHRTFHEIKHFQWLHWRLSNFTDGKVSKHSFLNILLTLPILCPLLPRSHCWVWNYFLWELFLQKKRNEEKQSGKTVILSAWLWYKKPFSRPRTLRRWTVWIPKYLMIKKWGLQPCTNMQKMIFHISNLSFILNSIVQVFWTCTHYPWRKGTDQTFYISYV